LIGGPNQSHKVNFKEPPHWGKISSKNFCVSPVNTYCKVSEKTLAGGPLLAVLDSPHRPAFAGGPRIEGRAEHARKLGLFKTFLLARNWKFINIFVINALRIAIWMKILHGFWPKIARVGGAGEPTRSKPGNVSVIKIHLAHGAQAAAAWRTMTDAAWRQAGNLRARVGKAAHSGIELGDSARSPVNRPGEGLPGEPHGGQIRGETGKIDPRYRLESRLLPWKGIS
jgi:hypothetical protein